VDGRGADHPEMLFHRLSMGGTTMAQVRQHAWKGMEGVACEGNSCCQQDPMEGWRSVLCVIQELEALPRELLCSYKRNLL